MKVATANVRGADALTISSFLAKRKIVFAALQELPPRTREVYVLRAMRRYKFNDIAVELRISNRAAQGHMARALAHIAKVINDDE